MIELVEVGTPGAEVQLNVLPGGHMLCTVAGISLVPTPAWLCREVAIRAARAKVQTTNEARSCVDGACGSPLTPTDEQLFQLGIDMLHDQPPLILNLDYEILHSNQKGPS